MYQKNYKFTLHKRTSEKLRGILVSHKIRLTMCIKNSVFKFIKKSIMIIRILNKKTIILIAYFNKRNNLLYLN